MTQVQLKWITAVCLCAAGAVCAAGQQKPNSAKTPTLGPTPTQVQVVNTTAQPVPTAAQGTTTVAGTVSISNTPTVNVGNTPSVVVSNTPTVSLASGGSVNVTSPLDSHNNPTPLAVFDAFQPWEDACSLNFLGNSSGFCTFRAVPGGKRLVIQEVDAALSLESNLWAIGFSIFPNQIPHALTLTLLGSGSGMNWYQTHQETHLYAPANALPTCGVTLAGPSANGAFQCDISGYLIDVQ